MAGKEAAASRAWALRRLAARAEGETAGTVAGRVAGPRSGVTSRLGLVGELLVSWIVAALIAAMAVGFGAAIVPAEEPNQTVPRMIAPDDTGADLDPRDTLVFCTMFVDHAWCIREPT